MAVSQVSLCIEFLTHSPVALWQVSLYKEFFTHLQIRMCCLCPYCFAAWLEVGAS